MGEQMNLPPREWVAAILEAINATRADDLCNLPTQAVAHALEAAKKIYAARTEGRGEGEPVALRKADVAYLVRLMDRDLPRAHCGEGDLDRKDREAAEERHAAIKLALYASPIREPEISREADWESAEQAARLINPKAWAEKDRLDASAFKGGYSAYLSKRLDESRKLARAILNLAPVAKGVSHDADLSDEFDRPGRLSDATRHSAEGTADPALSGARGVGEGWRPIETAEPKNSERLMVATADTPPVVGEAWWREDYDGKLDLWWAGEGPGDYHADPIRDSNQRVTHWQPLPTPPQEQGADHGL